MSAASGDREEGEAERGRPHLPGLMNDWVCGTRGGDVRLAWGVGGLNTVRSPKFLLQVWAEGFGKVWSKA